MLHTRCVDILDEFMRYGAREAEDAPETNGRRRGDLSIRGCSAQIRKVGLNAISGQRTVGIESIHPFVAGAGEAGIGGKRAAAAVDLKISDAAARRSAARGS